jgi:hypothetical protein
VNDDPLIERSLNRLRDAEPAPGFEQRLLVSLRNAAENSPRTKRLPLLVSWRSKLSFALVVLVAAGASIGALFLVRQQRLENQTALRPEKPMASLWQPASPAIAAQPLQRSKARASGKHSAKESSTATRVPARNTPAPPMPLTEQEKLLQRVARQRDAGNLTLLNPVAQHTQSAQATQQFQRFFAMTPEEVRTQFE